MNKIAQIKKEFSEKREELFNSLRQSSDSLKFSKEYSVLVEENIRKVCAKEKYNFAVTSAGSFSRWELSPFSDIDLMIISESVDKDKDSITNLITALWDSGIEVSHTVREISDIKKFLKTDLHAFTQFFETRFLYGNDSLYNKWNKSLLLAITEEDKVRLIGEFIKDMQFRHEKYGNSPKMLEPNVKMSAGGLRDLQSIEWMFMLSDKTLIDSQFDSTQTEVFLDIVKKNKYSTPAECKKTLSSYKFILKVRHFLHLITKSKTDRFEFSNQLALAEFFGYTKKDVVQFMKEYFQASNNLFRFSKSMLKKYNLEISEPLPKSLSYNLDDDFEIKGNIISVINKGSLTLSDILRAYYYRGLHSARFDENLRNTILEKIGTMEFSEIPENDSSVFFREILRLPKNVGSTLSSMNELGVLEAFLPEFKDLNGFMQPGVYHCYTADEHTLVTIQNLEKLSWQNSVLGNIYNNIRNKEILFLAMIFHDIAKPINIGGHEILGAEMASTVMHRLGYDEKEIDKVSFLVKNHLVMEQVAFRRNLSDPETLNNFASRFASVEDLNLLYLVTYADLSAVNPAVWTTWKSELLYELYRKSKAMIEDKVSGEQLLYSSTYIVPKEISKHSGKISEDHVQEHFDSLQDEIAYASHFTDKEIAAHIEEIEKGITVSVTFKDISEFTNITVITKDFPALLSKLCGVLAINDANIHDAKIFTRKDGIVIDTFNVTDFRTHRKIDPERYLKIKQDLNSVINGFLQLGQEVVKLKSRWKRIENKFFGRSGQVKVDFEKHEKYTIIDVHSPDRLGFLYQVTNKMSELGLIIHFAKISTKGDDIVDSFYVLDRKGKKISLSDQEFIKSELLETIKQIL